ncbi:hypothetical protein C8F04DRAFT_977319 [Mycena alexandri]|uniref:Uncharacterized protein n=1 Tax=Mycena alexandri TaxID=1745969 RepID=A0AAD6WMR3_9AGAR|nr:hypothetical protein C8F04DRAFT_977319 [Mycena alexandri]
MSDARTLGFITDIENEDDLTSFLSGGIGEENDEGGEANGNKKAPGPDARVPFPEWFQKRVNTLLEELKDDLMSPDKQSRHYKNGQFWIHAKSIWSSLRGTALKPTDLFTPDFFLWDPLSLLGKTHTLHCPDCGHHLTRGGVVNRPRRVIDIDSTFWLIGYTYHCQRTAGGGCDARFRSWDQRILQRLPHALVAEFPAHLTWRSGLSTRAFGIVRSCFQHGLGSEEFVNLLCSSQVIKAGRQVNGDLQRLAVAAGYAPTYFCGALDLAAFAKDRFLITKATLSLADIFAVIFHQCLPKNDTERVSSNWSDQELSDAQLEYAARDAYASLLLYHEINKTPLPLPFPTTETTPCGTPVLLLTDDNKKLAARGIVSVAASAEKFHGENLTKSRTVITVQEIWIPGAIIGQNKEKSGGRKLSLKDFGRVPFDVLAHRSHVRIKPIGPVTDMQSNDSPMPDAPEPNGHMPVDVQPPLDEHGVEMISVAEELNGALIEAYLKGHDVTWENMRRFHPKWLWRHCRRTIPPAEELYPLVHKVFMTYGPLKDAKTGLPLFNAAAWRIAKNILELVKNGHVSDPPGVQLYYCLGFDIKACGLPIYRCVRGTNNVEGGVHTHLLSNLPSRGASVRHMVACLLDFILCHNLRVGHFNSTGQKYTGHDSIWLLNEIQELEIMLGEHYNCPPIRLTWVNGNLYERTEQSAGIIQIPKSVRELVRIQPFNQETDSSQKQSYLAKMQGTRKPVLPIHTVAEKKLFTDLMRTSVTFQKCSTSISLPAAEIWNQKAEITADIYYKVNCTVAGVDTWVNFFTARRTAYCIPEWSIQGLGQHPSVLCSSTGPNRAPQSYSARPATCDKNCECNFRPSCSASGHYWI